MLNDGQQGAEPNLDRIWNLSPSSWKYRLSFLYSQIRFPGRSTSFDFHFEVWQSEDCWSSERVAIPSPLSLPPSAPQPFPIQGPKQVAQTFPSATPAWCCRGDCYHVPHPEADSVLPRKLGDVATTGPEIILDILPGKWTRVPGFLKCVLQNEESSCGKKGSESLKFGTLQVKQS